MQSVNLERKLRFDFGRNILSILGSSDLFLISSRTIACFISCGTLPLPSDKFTICVIQGTEDGLFLTKLVGRGSSSRKADDDSEIARLISCSVAGSKHDN